MSAEYVRRAYGVDYKVGDRLVIDGKPGTLVCFPEQYLGVRLDESPRRVSRCHPTWHVEREATPCEHDTLGCGDRTPHDEHTKLGDGRPCCGWPPRCTP